MVDHDATVLDDGDPGCAESFSGLVMPDAELHPDPDGVHRKREYFVDVGGNVHRCPENVDQIGGFGELSQRAGAALAQNAIESGVDRQDLVALSLQVGRNAVSIGGWVGLDSHYGDSSCDS